MGKINNKCEYDHCVDGYIHISGFKFPCPFCRDVMDHEVFTKDDGRQITGKLKGMSLKRWEDLKWILREDHNMANGQRLQRGITDRNMHQIHRHSKKE